MRKSNFPRGDKNRRRRSEPPRPSSTRRAASGPRLPALPHFVAVTGGEGRARQGDKVRPCSIRKPFLRADIASRYSRFEERRAFVAGQPAEVASRAGRRTRSAPRPTPPAGMWSVPDLGPPGAQGRGVSERFTTPFCFAKNRQESTADVNVT